MASYLLTGAAGFIASRTAELLLAAGHRVVGVDNLNDYYDVGLKRHRLARLARAAGAANFRFHEADIEHPEALAPLFAAHGFDAVLNLAARAGVRYSIDHPEVYVSTNVLGELHLLELMRRHGVRKQVLASSSTLYAGTAMPFREDRPVERPLSPYAASKQAAEALAASYHHLHGISTTVLRYFTVYGPAGRPDMAVYRFIEAIDTGAPLAVFGDGTQARDFTYVDDIARGTIAALALPGFEVVNLGGGRNPIPLTDLIARLAALLGKPAPWEEQPFHAADMKATWADIAKAGRLLGWQPEVSLDEGLRRTVAWHRDYRAGRTDPAP